MEFVTAVCHLKGMSRYSQSRPIPTKRGDKETANDHEERTWRERLHVNADGEVIITPMTFKNALSEAARYNPRQIPGKGKTTYTKHIEAGVMVIAPSPLGIKAEDVPGERVFVPSDGRRGGSSRVWKIFPYIDAWECYVEFHILDKLVTQEVFTPILKEAGRFIGIGRFRPRNNGFYGRFDVLSVEWNVIADELAA